MSDGLLGDLGHILAASGVGAEIELAKTTELIAASALFTGPGAIFDAELLHQCTLAGGDDYELAFTAAPTRRAAVQAAARQAGVAVTRIGRTTAAPGLRLLDAQGQPQSPAWASFDHFA